MSERYKCTFEECEFSAETSDEVRHHVAQDWHCPTCGTSKGQNFAQVNLFSVCGWCWTRKLDTALLSAGKAGIKNA